MNRSDLLARHAELTESARKLMTAKNQDYAGEQAATHDSLANFRMAVTMGIAKDVPTSVLVRLTDKVMRLASFCRAGTLAVKGESVRDTVLDIINYAVLFDAANCCICGSTGLWRAKPVGHPGPRRRHETQQVP